MKPEKNRIFIWICHGQDGAALIMAIGVIMVMLITGTLVVSISMNRARTVSHDQQLTEAESIAEAGADEAINVTLGNYASVYRLGIPPADSSGDGDQLFADKPLKNSSGETVGTYSVWTKADPDRPGNVLITATGTDNSSNPFSSTVRVSVKYVSNFDYVLFTGAPDNLKTTTLTAQSRNGGWGWWHNFYDCDGDDEHGDDGACAANITVTGKVNVNGNMVVDAVANGDDDNHDGWHHHDYQPGYVTFLSRTGFTDFVNYSGTLSGKKPSGLQPLRSGTMAFPTVDFSKFSSSYVNVNMPSSGAPSGWTRSGGHGNSPVIYSISADEFQSRYGSYNIVKLSSSRSRATVQIIGSCNSPAITSTIMMEGVSGSSGTPISELDLIGPGLDLQPANGIAILSGEGLVTLQDEVEIGGVDDGALVYLGGQNGTSQLQMEGSMIVYGTIAVNGQVDITGTGEGKVTHHQHHEDHHYGSYNCDADYDHHHDDHHHDGDEDYNTLNMYLTYDGNYLTNTNLPQGWWSWNGSGAYTALKYNFVRD